MLVDNQNKELCLVNSLSANGDCCCNCRYMKRNFIGGTEVAWVCDLLIHMAEHDNYRLQDFEGLTYIGLPGHAHELCEMYERVGSKPIDELEIE